MLKNVLEYQSIDLKIVQLKEKLASNPAKKTLNKMIVLAKDAQAKLIELENQAKSTMEQYEKINKEFNDTCEKLNNLIKQDTAELPEDKLRENIEKASALSITLGNLERSLSYQKDVVTNILKNFDLYRKNIVLSKQKYKESKEEYDAVEKQILPEIEALKKEMTAIESKTDASLLAKYKHLRQDGIFPVFVPLKGNACGGCRMEIPAALMAKLKQNGYLECEQCRRLIYIEQ